MHRCFYLYYLIIPYKVIDICRDRLILYRRPCFGRRGHVSMTIGARSAVVIILNDARSLLFISLF